MAVNEAGERYYELKLDWNVPGGDRFTWAAEESLAKLPHCDNCRECVDMAKSFKA